MTGRRPPLVVLPATGDEELSESAAALTAEGWRVVEGVANPPVDLEPSVCRAVLRDAGDCGSAVLAAAWGHGVLLGIGALPEPLADRLLDDLARIGPLDRRRAPARPALDGEGESLLRLLSEGHSLGDAARSLHLSRRTADRRLAEVRRALGAETTAAAISRWRGQGRGTAG